MLKAIIFDFNGIILNDEPIHFQAMRDAVADIGVHISEEEYWNKYLPFDDERCLEAIAGNHSRVLTAEETRRVLNHKIAFYSRYLQGNYSLFPGVSRFIRAAAECYALAIASGARRDEIEATLSALGLSEYFRVIVAAQDFALGKPHPESFLLALARLNEQINGDGALVKPSECLVIEDSVGGVEGARAAGMLCLAVTNSYPAEKLGRANRVVASLEEINLDCLCNIFEDNS